MTGFANGFDSLGGRWLELFKEAVPHLIRVADIFFVSELLRGPRAIALPDPGKRYTITAAAAQLGVTIIRMTVRNAVEIEPALSAFACEPNGGLLLSGVAPSFEAIARLACPGWLLRAAYRNKG